MSRFTVVIKNRFADEQTVARIKTFDDKKYQNKGGILATMLSEQVNVWIDNDIYYADIEVEETDEN